MENKEVRFNSVTDMVDDYLRRKADKQKIKELENIMTKFGEAHIMLAKTKLPPREYNLISNKLAQAKVGLFNFYNTFKNQRT